MSGRYVTDEAVPLDEQYEVYRLCECTTCAGRGKVWTDETPGDLVRCPACRGEGRTRELVATCGTPEALGVALTTLGKEGEFQDCPIGILHRLGQPGEKWLVRPWLPSARNVSDAGRTLRQARKGK